MIKKHMIDFCVCACVLISCSMGGGGGKHYSPYIAINEIGVKKEKAQEFKIGEKAIINVDDQEQLIKEDASIQNDKYYYFRGFTFCGKQYRLGIPLDDWVSIIDSTDNVIIKLKLPRYSRNAAALELSGDHGKKYLAIYISQQLSSYSSTLYILSDEWKVLYKEHLLWAEWISKESSEYGDTLLVSETHLEQNDKCERVNNLWKYIIFNP